MYFAVGAIHAANHLQQLIIAARPLESVGEIEHAGRRYLSDTAHGDRALPVAKRECTHPEAGSSVQFWSIELNAQKLTITPIFLNRLFIALTYSLEAALPGDEVRGFFA